MTAHLDHLEEQGYDVSAIRSAVESGDMDTARTLMQQFMEEHRDEFPAPPGKEDRMTAHLDHLEEQGYDVSAIRSAVESGDMDTARTLMHQFMEEHRDEFPAPPGMEKGCRGIPGSERNQDL
jgi:DNA-binding GntR family transcriptional regulator